MDRACEGRVALVTGASRGIGAAIAARLAEAGARVAIAARTLEAGGAHDGSLRELAASIAASGGEALAVRADISQADDRSRLVAETVERLGPVDILVNNAAVTWVSPVEEFAEKRYRVMFEVQVRAAFELAQQVLPAMRERGCGWILNVSSRAANHPAGPPFETSLNGLTVYGMCKAALERFTTGLAAETYDDNIAVNALAPWDIVPTAGAGTHGFLSDYPTEGPELMAEAALAFCSGNPRELTGRIAYSQQLLAELGRRPPAAGSITASTNPRAT